MRDFLVKIDKENPLFKEFKDWFLERYDGKLDFSFNYYGFIDEHYDFSDSLGDWNCEISLEEWHKEFTWQPKQGETIEASRNGVAFWECSFVAKYGKIYIVENSEGELIKVNEIRKLNPLSEDIEKLKEKAKSLGLKIDVIYEAI